MSAPTLSRFARAPRVVDAGRAGSLAREAARCAGGIVALAAAVFGLGLAILRQTGDNRAMILATALGIALFLWLYVAGARRRVLIAFLVAWAAFAVGGFAAPTQFVMGSDVHRELRVVSYFGASSHWDPLAMAEISFSSAWLVLGTRAISDLTGLPFAAVLKYVYPALLAAASVPLFLLFERVAGERRAFAAVFLAVSLLSFWESTTQIAKASIATFLGTTLLFVLVRAERSERPVLAVAAVLVVALVLTHYTTAVLVLAVLLLGWIAEWGIHLARRTSGLPSDRPAHAVGVVSLLGCAVYAAWYVAIPYVMVLIATSLRRPFDYLRALVLRENASFRTGESLAGTLGDASTLGYATLRVSLLLLAAFAAYGWVREARVIFLSREKAEEPRVRAFAIQTLALALTAVGIVVPTQLDANRLFAFSLFVGASFATAWWPPRPRAEVLVATPADPAAAPGAEVVQRMERRARALRRREVGALVAAAFIVAAQMGLLFLAIDQRPFSTNLGEGGPVHERYAHDEESVALREWAFRSGAQGLYAVTPDLGDFLEEDPRVPLDDVRILSPAYASFVVFEPGKHETQIACAGFDADGVPGARHLVFDSGRLRGYADC